MKKLKFRPNTIDKNIFGMIYLVNEYHMPDQFDQEDIIIDIGAHGGYFAITALRKGAGKVIAIEANQANYKLARENLSEFLDQDSPKVDLRYAAVWRSDKNEDILYHHTFEDLFNTGSSFVSVKKGDGISKKIALDDLIMEATDQGKKRIRMLKIDCEGAEFPILLTSKKLDLVDEISGEYHETDKEVSDSDQSRKKSTSERLKLYLEKYGFTVRVKPCEKFDDKKWTNLGMFYATRF